MLHQLNINGIRGKQTELATFLKKNKINIAKLQETKLDAKAKEPKIPGYMLIRETGTLIHWHRVEFNTNVEFCTFGDGKKWADRISIAIAIEAMNPIFV